VNKTNTGVSYVDWIGHKDLRDCKCQPQLTSSPETYTTGEDSSTMKLSNIFEASYRYRKNICQIPEMGTSVIFQKLRNKVTENYITQNVRN
jgi:hypothetical protein